MPFDVDLKADCGKDLDSRCWACCDCKGLELPDEEAFTKAVLEWIVSFMLERYGVAVGFEDFFVSSACRPDKLSLHLALPWRLPTAAERVQFKAQLKDAGAGAQAMAKLTGEAVDVIDLALDAMSWKPCLSL